MAAAQSMVMLFGVLLPLVEIVRSPLSHHLGPISPFTA
jgi:hypothetical protein